MWVGQFVKRSCLTAWLGVVRTLQVLAYVDTLLLTDTTQLDALAGTMVSLMDSVRPSAARGSQTGTGAAQGFFGGGTGPQKFYAIAALANAAAHPRLAEIIKLNGGEHIVNSRCIVDTFSENVTP